MRRSCVAFCNVAFWCGVLAWRSHVAFLRGVPECHAGMHGVLVFPAGLEQMLNICCNNFTKTCRQSVRTSHHRNKQTMTRTVCANQKQTQTKTTMALPRSACAHQKQKMAMARSACASQKQSGTYDETQQQSSIAFIPIQLSERVCKKLYYSTE